MKEKYLFYKKALFDCDEIKSVEIFGSGEILSDGTITSKIDKVIPKRCLTSYCSHNTSGRSLDKPCSIGFPP
jgi:hypothetical protein